MDVLASALVQTVLENLTSIVTKQIGLTWGFEKELQNLESVLMTIQLVLNDAELKQRKDGAIGNWLQKLKDATYDVENILDEVATEALLKKVGSKTGQVHKLNAFVSRRNPLIFKFRIAKKVKSIMERLDAIAEEKRNFHLVDGVVMDNYRVSDMVAENRQTGSLVTKLDVYGRNEESDLIIEKVVSCALDRDDLSVYGICGMGGIGKTTLAQLVYNDERVEGHFDLRIWVCVSVDFSIQRLTKAIMESIDGCGCTVSELDTLQRRIQEKLRGKRFLLVLDDVWNEDNNLWDGLKRTISCGSNGSVLVVTSRSVRVANMMSAIGIHNVQCLSDEDSWLVFSRRAFAVREKQEYMEEIGKEIVKKCGGLPIAVQALGSLMRRKSSESEWLAIQASETWQLLDVEGGILPALWLSYDNLPVQVRQCFVYCCIFPKDYEMAEDTLIQLWMANGFLSSGVETDLYITGRSIVKELIWRSFFQVARDHRGNSVFKLHDLMHDLAEYVMRHETCIMEHGKLIKTQKTLRHVYMDKASCGVFFENKNKLKLPKSLRSFIMGECFGSVSVEFLDFLSKQQYLRVLDLNVRHDLTKISRIIFKLQHLRYLVISCFKIKRLPESLTRLQNLQTLKLMETWDLVELPKGMKCMKNLYFLEMGSGQSLVCTPPELGELTCLQKLSVFIVGPDSGHQIDQLKDLNLGGDLSIKRLDYVRNFEDAESANLMAKRNLTSLNLSWYENSTQLSVEHFEEVLKGLQPNQNLERIHIVSYQGLRFPEWMSTVFFRNLGEIKLESCDNCEHLPALGKLPSLKRLKLYGMNSIKHLGAEWHGDGTFPALTMLAIKDMDNLEEWTKPVSMESFPCLKDLTIDNCPKLSGIPYLSTLKTLNLKSIKNMALLRFVTDPTSITSLSLCDACDLDVLPVGLLKEHNALKTLEIINLPFKSLANELDNLLSLQSLVLHDCSNLEALPEGLTHLNSLENLDISGCHSLESIPAILFQGLSSLKHLTIESCKKLKYSFSGPLSSTLPLHNLIINDLPELEVLPESMQQLTALGMLYIRSCEKLSSLPNWIGNLQSLRRMEILRCGNLKSLPDSFQNLKSMSNLWIMECPHLEKRCKKPEGEDWPKISHIPNIKFGWR